MHWFHFSWAERRKSERWREWVNVLFSYSRSSFLSITSWGSIWNPCQTIPPFLIHAMRDYIFFLFNLSDVLSEIIFRASYVHWVCFWMIQVGIFLSSIQSDLTENLPQTLSTYPFFHTKCKFLWHFCSWLEISWPKYDLWFSAKISSYIFVILEFERDTFWFLKIPILFWLTSTLQNWLYWCQSTLSSISRFSFFVSLVFTNWLRRPTHSRPPLCWSHENFVM